MPRASDYSTLVSPLLDDLVEGIDHIGICVSQLEDAGRGWAALLGLDLVDRELVETQRTKVAFLRPGEPCSVELICPMPDNPGLAKFLDKRGDALHHVAFAVSDIDLALERLSGAKVALIDERPRRGAGGHRVAFLHPRAVGGVLVELVERTHAQE